MNRQRAVLIGLAFGVLAASAAAVELKPLGKKSVVAPFMGPDLLKAALPGKSLAAPGKKPAVAAAKAAAKHSSGSYDSEHSRPLKDKLAEVERKMKAKIDEHHDSGSYSSGGYSSGGYEHEHPVRDKWESIKSEVHAKIEDRKAEIHAKIADRKAEIHAKIEAFKADHGYHHDDDYGSGNYNSGDYNHDYDDEEYGDHEYGDYERRHFLSPRRERRAARRAALVEKWREHKENHEGDHDYDRDYGDHDYGDHDYGDHDYGDHDYGDHDYGNHQKLCDLAERIREKIAEHCESTEGSYHLRHGSRLSRLADKIHQRLEEICEDDHEADGGGYEHEEEEEGDYGSYAAASAKSSSAKSTSAESTSAKSSSAESSSAALKTTSLQSAATADSTDTQNSAEQSAFSAGATATDDATDDAAVSLLALAEKLSDPETLARLSALDAAQADGSAADEEVGLLAELTFALRQLQGELAGSDAEVVANLSLLSGLLPALGDETSDLATNYAASLDTSASDLWSDASLSSLMLLGGVQPRHLLDDSLFDSANLGGGSLSAFSSAAVPEPASWLLLLIGALTLAFRRFCAIHRR